MTFTSANFLVVRAKPRDHDTTMKLQNAAVIDTNGTKYVAGYDPHGYFTVVQVDLCIPGDLGYESFEEATEATGGVKVSHDGMDFLAIPTETEVYFSGSGVDDLIAAAKNQP